MRIRLEQLDHKQCGHEGQQPEERVVSNFAEQVHEGSIRQQPLIHGQYPRTGPRAGAMRFARAPRSLERVRPKDLMCCRIVAFAVSARMLTCITGWLTGDGVRERGESPRLGDRNTGLS